LNLENFGLAIIAGYIAASLIDYDTGYAKTSKTKPLGPRVGIGGQDIHLHNVPINQKTKDQWGITAPALKRELHSGIGDEYVYPGSIMDVHGRRGIQKYNQPEWQPSGGIPISYHPSSDRLSLAWAKSKYPDLSRLAPGQDWARGQHGDGKGNRGEESLDYPPWIDLKTMPPKKHTINIDKAIREGRIYRPAPGQICPTSQKSVVDGIVYCTSPFGPHGENYNLPNVGQQRSHFPIGEHERLSVA
jgi:hypothetical protein